VDEVIERMDEYYLSKEDWDSLIEIGVGEFAEAIITKKILSYSDVYDRYNSSEHPIAFHKASELGLKTTKKIAKGEVPDVEEAIDLDDEAGDEEPEQPVDDDDISKDKLIKGTTGKGKAKATKAAGKSKAKKDSK
jgi:replication factor C subunit 1